MVTWNDYLPAKTKGIPFAAQMMEQEMHYLSEAIEKEITLSDGTIIDVEASRLHWTWYDRLCERYLYFNEDMAKKLKKVMEKHPEYVSCDFEYFIEKHIYDLWQKGHDPFFTRSQIKEKDRAMSVFERRFHGEETCNLFLPVNTGKKSN